MADIIFKPVLAKPIDITPESIKDERITKVRVRNPLNLDDLSNLHLQTSATVEVQHNTVLGLVFKSLSTSGQVPWFSIDETITEDKLVTPISVRLERIGGAETLFQGYFIDKHKAYLQDFTPAIYLLDKQGKPVPIIEKDLSRLRLADYTKMVVGVQFAPITMDLVGIMRKWRSRFKGLREGRVELTELRDDRGKVVDGAYSITDGWITVPKKKMDGSYPLRDVYSRPSEKKTASVDATSLTAAADEELRKRGMNPIYRIQDTYLDGKLYERGNILLTSVPGLEIALLNKDKIIDPRDVGVLVEAKDKERKESGQRIEPDWGTPRPKELGDSRPACNQTESYGRRFDVVAMIQGVYDRSSFKGAKLE